MSQRRITNTTQAWQFLKPRLRGSWERVEVSFPNGFPDLVGFYRARTHLVEVKVGRDKMRPAQDVMRDNANAQYAVIWQCHVTHDGIVTWLPITPSFYVEP